MASSSFSLFQGKQVLKVEKSTAGGRREKGEDRLVRRLSHMPRDEQPKVSISRHQPLSLAHKGTRTWAVFAMAVMPCHTSSGLSSFQSRGAVRLQVQVCREISGWLQLCSFPRGRAALVPGACRQGQGCSQGRLVVTGESPLISHHWFLKPPAHRHHLIYLNVK